MWPAIALLLGLIAAAPTTAPLAPTTSAGITIARDTTYFTGPVAPDGTIDYEAAINAEERGDITPGENAAALVIQIVDPGLDTPPDPQWRARLRHLLGVEDPPRQEAGWHDWQGFGDTPRGRDSPPAYLEPRYQNARSHAWSATDLPELADWVRFNSRAMATVTQASLRPRYWMPVLRKSGDELDYFQVYPPPRLWSYITDAFLIRAMLRLNQSDLHGAIQDLLTLQRLGGVMAQSTDVMTIALGARMRDQARAVLLWSVLQNSRLSEEDLRRLAADMNSMTTISVNPLRAYRRTRFIILDHLQSVADGWINPLVDWDQAFGYVNAFYDQLDAICMSPSDFATTMKAVSDRIAREDKQAEAADLFDIHNDPWLWPKVGENRQGYSRRVGQYFAVVEASSYSSGWQNIFRANVRFDWTAKAAISLALYREDHGQYPDRIEALIPGYLPRLPDDPTAFPIHYDRRGDGYVIHYVRPLTPAVQAALVRQGNEFYDGDVIIRTDRGF